MRLRLLLPEVEPDCFVVPQQCPIAGCKGKRFYPRQAVEKKIVDAKHPQVQAWRYQCNKCGHTFRVYPQGVSGLGVMLYILGLSYGAVAIVLDTLGIGIGKTSIYRTVQAVAE